MDTTTTQFAFDGHCAFAISTGKLDVTGGNHSLTIDGKIYLFSNIIAKVLFKILPGTIDKANQNWTNK